MKLMKKIIVTGMLTAVMMTELTAFGASHNWVHTDGGWRYHTEDGYYPYGGWFQDTDSTWYYFDAGGYMQTGWVKSGGCWYYLDPSGAMATGWRYLGSYWYYFAPNGVMRTGWVSINGNLYYLGSGELYTNCTINNGYSDSSGVWKPLKTPEKADADLSGVSTRLAALEQKYPTGRYWNHAGLNPDPFAADRYLDSSGYLTDIPCDHRQSSGNPELDALKVGPYCNQYLGGFQCDGFALKMMDELFPDGNTEVILDGTFEELHVGDYVRFDDEHSVIVTEKSSTDIKVAECNYNNHCEINWGRSISKNWIDKRNLVIITGYELQQD